jgi:hypothetical protein
MKGNEQDNRGFDYMQGVAFFLVQAGTMSVPKGIFF